MITTSMLWLKMAPSGFGHARRQASQLMHSSMSMYIGSFFQTGFRSRVSRRIWRPVFFGPFSLAGSLTVSLTFPTVVPRYGSRPTTRLKPPEHQHIVSDETHLFLSPGWISAARELRAEYEDKIPEPPIAVLINVVVTDMPHSDGRLDGHVDSSDGQLIIDEGHLDEPELTVTIDYDTARTIFVKRDPAELMQAFFGGKILVEGDASRLLMLQAEAPTEHAVEVYERLAAFTAPDPE